MSYLYSCCLLILSLFIVSCSGGFDSESSSSISIDTLISGKVTSDGSSFAAGLNKVKPFNSEYNGSLSLSGCTVNALSLQDSTVLATTTSDDQGNYYLKGEGIKSGENYKINANCSGNSFTSVGQAITKNQASITDEDRIQTNPRTTIISAYIVKTIVEAIQEAVSSIADPVAEEAVKKSIYESMSSIIKSIETNINEAIDSGAMPEPTVSEATSVASAVNNANESTSAANIDTSLNTANIDAPPAVDQAIAGAKNSAGSLGACHPVAGDINACTRAIAKIIHNGLKFNILIEKNGSFGQTSAITTCVDSHIVDGAITLADEFPESNIVEGTTMAAHLSDFCVVQNRFASIDRNRGYESLEDFDSSAVFAESGNMDAVAGSEVGIITSIAAAMFSGDKFNLASINNMLFSHQNGAGFNLKFVNTVKDPISSDQYFYKNSSLWEGANWPVDVMTSEPKHPETLDVVFASPMDWSTLTGTDSAVATTIGSTDFSSLQIMENLFGGAIPSQEEVASYIDDEKRHIEHNITGAKEVQVLTNDYPGSSPIGQPNPCYDEDPMTPCLDASGDALQALSVEMTLSTADANGLKTIATMDTAGSDYYLRPIYSNNGFNGLMTLIKADDGRVVRDEYFRERVMKVVLDTSECGSDGLPGGCSDGELFNATLDWSTCGSGDCPSFIASTQIAATALTIDVQDYYNQIYDQDMLYLAIQDNFENKRVKVTVSSGAGDDPIVFAGLGVASAGEYNVISYSVCTGGTCTFSGFILVDESGQPYSTDTDATNKIVFNSLSDVAVYTPAHLNTGNDFDPNTANTTIQEVALFRSINNAPVVNKNHRCESEPYYIDSNFNNSLDCHTIAFSIGGNTVEISTADQGDVSFSSRYEYDKWINDPFISAAARSARQSQTLKENLNGFRYENPIAMNSLLSTAFNGMLDGNHTLNGTTELDALQAFALIFMYFESGGTKILPHLGAPQSDEYMSISPFIFAPEADFLKIINDSLGKSFVEFKNN